jgi:hypothetical protein
MKKIVVILGLLVCLSGCEQQLEDIFSMTTAGQRMQRSEWRQYEQDLKIARNPFASEAVRLAAVKAILKNPRMRDLAKGIAKDLAKDNLQPTATMFGTAEGEVRQQTRTRLNAWDTQVGQWLYPPSCSSNLQIDAYGLGVHMNEYGQPVRLRPDFGSVPGEYLEITPNAYGLGVHMDQYGRPVREYPWP